MGTMNQDLLDTADTALGIYAFGSHASANYALAFERNENGTATVRNLPVFKTGTHTDSQRRVQTWGLSDLEQMVANFTKLEDSFPNIPVRKDHSRSVEQIAGYVSRLHTDGDLLLADFNFTEPEDADKWERGTFRSRSAEVGAFQTNDGTVHNPVFQGFAFVDIPAVEGLFSKTDQPKDVRFFTEADMTIKPDPVAVPVAVPVVEPVVAPVVELTKPVEAATFTINGVETSDYTAVAAHLVRLETFADEQRTAGRSAFATALGTDKKIGAPQVEAMSEFALMLDDQQFAKLEAVYAAAPVLPLLADHSAGSVTNPDGEDGKLTAAQQELADAEAIVLQHRRSGMTQDQIEKTASFTKLTALRAELTK